MNPPAESRSRGWLFFLVRLADRPANVVCLALALNALVQPYLGFTHDARLYAASVTERVGPGSFGQDLYLAYGSQDRYTAFTLLMAPLVAALGLHAAFFLVYLASKALLFWGAVRLLRVVLRDRVAVLLSLAFLAVTPVPYGGNDIFHLNESFLTPRLSACGLVLLGLERLLAARPGQALAALGGAFLLHPLMAVAGALVGAVWFASRRLSPRWLAGLTAALALAVGFLLWYEPLGARVLGHMDRDWRDLTLTICFFIRPAEWLAGDWARMALAFAVACGAARFLGGGTSRFLLAVACTGLAGVIGQVVAVGMDYRLLVQTSPYRTVWLMEFLCVPLLLLACVRLWRGGTVAGKSAALGLLLAATTGWGVPTTPTVAGLTGAVFVVAALGWRGAARAPRRPDWLWPASVTAFAAAVVLLTLTNGVFLRTLLVTTPEFDLDLHPVWFLSSAGGVLYKLPLLLAGGVGAWALAALLGTRAGFRAALLGLWAGYQTVLALANQSAWYGERFSTDYRHCRFVASFVEDKSVGRRATVYWPADLRAIWFGAEANSYFNVVQLSGCAFNRGTALEGRRRAALVRKFEYAAIRKEPAVPSFWRTALSRLYQVTDDDAPPTAADLVRLCQDPLLDVVVLEHEFDGLYAATDGKFYVYDCEQIRRQARAASSNHRDTEDTEKTDREREKSMRRVAD